MNSMRGYLIFLFIAMFSLPACALGPMCGSLRGLKREVSSLKAIPVNIKGTDDRKAQEEFGHPDHIEAQRILGLSEIKNSITGVMAIECLYTKSNGKTYRNRFNGILACDKETVVINAHSMYGPLCENVNPDDFKCTVKADETSGPGELIKPKASQIMVKNLCGQVYNEPDIAVLKLKKPSDRAPLKIGAPKNFQDIQGRRFVSIAANTTKNFVDKNGQPIQTDKTFTVSQFDELHNPYVAKSDTDGGNGGSGEAHLIKQEGELLVIGLREGSRAPLDSNGRPIDGEDYDLFFNYTTSIFFEQRVQDFIRSQVKDADKCIREIRSEGEVSI